MVDFERVETRARGGGGVAVEGGSGSGGGSAKMSWWEPPESSKADGEKCWIFFPFFLSFFEKNWPMDGDCRHGLGHRHVPSRVNIGFTGLYSDPDHWPLLLRFLFFFFLLLSGSHHHHHHHHRPHSNLQ